MLSNRLINKFAVSAMLLCTLIGLGGQVAQAQRLRNTSLLRGRCVSSGLGSARESSQNVAIGRAVYTSLFYLGSGNRSAALTCNIKPDTAPEPIFQNLTLGFGMRDNDTSSPTVTVNIYLDGKQAASRTVKPTQAEIIPLDVSNVSNVAIEAVCGGGGKYCDRVHFFQATLEPKQPPAKN